jgi:hypothetical protein
MDISKMNSEDRTLQKRCGMMIERIVNEDILTCCSYLVSDCLNEDSLQRIRENESMVLYDEDEDRYIDVFEYWIVTSWLADKLRKHNECVTAIGYQHIWSRTTTGQSIKLDQVIIDLARELV